MRLIFTKAIEPSPQELFYFAIISNTNDRHGLSVEAINIKFTFAGFEKLPARTIRKFNEKWNNFKYLNITPTFKIRKLKTRYASDEIQRRIKPDARYRKVDKDSTHQSESVTQAKLDMLEYIKKYYNTLRILDEVNSLNSITVQELLDRSDEYHS